MKSSIENMHTDIRVKGFILSPVVQYDVWCPDLSGTHVNNLGAIIVSLVPIQVRIHPLLNKNCERGMGTN